MSRKAVQDALASTDWTGAAVDREPRPVSVVHSVRFPAGLSKRLEAEADRQGVTPSVLVRDLAAAAVPSSADPRAATPAVRGSSQRVGSIR